MLVADADGNKASSVVAELVILARRHLATALEKWIVSLSLESQGQRQSL